MSRLRSVARLLLCHATMSSPPPLPASFARTVRQQLSAIGAEADGEGLPPLEPLEQLIRHLRGVRSAQRREALEQVLSMARERELGARIRGYAGRLFRAMRARSGLADLGLLPSHGLFTEIRARFFDRLLPSHRPPHELSEVLRVIFEPSDAPWVEALDDRLALELLEAFSPDDDLARRTLAQETLFAINLLSHRIAAAGEEPVFLGFEPASIDHESPFLAQAEHMLELTAAQRRAMDGEEGEPPDPAQVQVMLSQCRDQLKRMRRRAPETGATLRMNYEIERIDDALERVSLLLGTLSPDAALARSARVRLLRALVEGQAEAERIRPLIRRASHLVTTEIASRAGMTGEHYITRTPREWGGMWLAAAGAGLIVAMMACIKVGVSGLHAPPLLEAFWFSVNYALGFAIVGFLGLTIATKQPAMTAAAIASAIEPHDGKSGPAQRRALVETIQALFRSQLAAIAGNCLVAFPAALALSLAFAWLAGRPIADVEKATHLAHDLDPLHSLALAHAALTGVWLSLSGIVAGYVTSSVLARHIPSRITRSARLIRVLGAARVQRLAEGTRSHAGALAGSIVLGILLGSTGTLGALLGLPIDIRHVSFGSANLGLALATLGPSGIDGGRMLAGIAGIGALNLAVSFSLSLGLALHARQRSLRDLPGLFADLGRSLVRELPAWLLPVGPSAQRVERPAERSHA